MAKNAASTSAPPSNATRWFGFLLVLLSLVVEGFDLQAANFASPSVMETMHLSPVAMGPFQSASLFGVLIGAVMIAPMGDRFGRRSLIIACCIAYGILSLAASFATSLTELILLRVVIGIGLGGVLPNALALAGEYAPEKLLASASGLVGIGITFGGVVAGATAAKVLPVHGWQGLFVAGGILPLVIAALLWIGLPESPALRKKNETIKSDVRVAQLLAPDERSQTFAIWISFTLVLLVAYLLSGWIPLIIKQQGYSIETASWIATAGHAGGVIGGIVASIALSRKRWPIVSIFAAIAALVMLLLASNDWSVGVMAGLVALQGFFSVGTQNGLNGSAGAHYPAQTRALGLGWALGMGRVGSIMGPLAGSLIAMFGMGAPRHFFFLPIIPLLIASLLAFYLSRATKPKESLS